MISSTPHQLLRFLALLAWFQSLRRPRSLNRNRLLPQARGGVVPPMLDSR